MIKTNIVPSVIRCSLERAWRAADGSDDHGPAVARWDAGPLGVDYICKGCLDVSLDYADSMGGVGEPDTLTWVLRPVDRVCVVHFWPAALCRAWSHGTHYNRFGQAEWSGDLHMPESSHGGPAVPADMAQGIGGF